MEAHHLGQVGETSEECAVFMSPTLGANRVGALRGAEKALSVSAARVATKLAMALNREIILPGDETDAQLPRVLGPSAKKERVAESRAVSDVAHQKCRFSCCSSMPPKKQGGANAAAARAKRWQAAQCVESITACLDTRIRPQVLTSCVLNGPHGDAYAVTVAKRNLWHTQVVQASPHAQCP